MSRSTRPALLKLLTLALSLSAFTTPVLAETYRVDLIVFVDLWQTGSEAGTPVTAPNIKNAMLAEDASGLRAAGITILPDAQFGLDKEWKNLRYSKQFKPLLRLSWTQKDPPAERGPALRIKLSGVPGATGTAVSGSGLSPMVDGSVALLLVKNYLTVDADLQYVADGQQWRLDDRRRMRRDEIHHLDSARLGVLTQVSKSESASQP